MDFLKRLFHTTPPSPPVDENGALSSEKIIELISERASNFMGRRGLVCVIQLSWRVQIFFLNGVTECNWRVINGQLQLFRGSGAYLEHQMTLELQKQSFKNLQKKLKTHFRNHDINLVPLSEYANEQWCLWIKFE
ncbi:MAG: hypothetical protein JW914_05410 [Syntrophaceae bacterium]|nr:hypothetical protein [Syntrophaceae bacterium]